jgi:hypothetical protein
MDNPSNPWSFRVGYEMELPKGNVLKPPRNTLTPLEAF